MTPAHCPSRACRLEPVARHGDGRVRTDDPLLAKQVLSQLSYAPVSTASPGPSVFGHKSSEPRRATASHFLTTGDRHLTTDPWAREDSNLRPHAYQACALTS